MSDIKVRSVSWLVRQIAGVLDSAPVLHNVVLEAELSNFHAHSSGHWYFSLKDDRSRIDATMWENDNLLVNFSPKDGDKVRVLCNVTIYQVQGKVQVTVKRMAKAGAGDLKALFDALYKKLNAEGLFDADHKKPIPLYPMNIGLVTGSATHARADVYNTLGRRWPIAAVHEYPSLVQGEAAPAELIAALKKADQGNHDVILLCRGGGSSEDLWCFNDEALARTIYAMRTPVITGVGHEPDWTMVDYVADLRAPTPTGAAERATPDIAEVKANIQNLKLHLKRLMEQRLIDERTTLKEIQSIRYFREPMTLIREQQMHKDMSEQRFLRLLNSASMKTQHTVNEKKQKLFLAVNDQCRRKYDTLNDLEQRMKQAVKEKASETRSELMKQAKVLDAYSPLKVMERGYSVVYADNRVINSATDVHEADLISIRLHAGQIQAKVTAVEENGYGKEKVI